MRFFATFALCLFLSACQATDSDPARDFHPAPEPETIQPLSPTLLKNYLMKNKMSADAPIHLFVFGDKESFSVALGTSSRMPAPTKIDFKTEAAVLMVLPDSKTERKIVIEDVFRQGGHIHVLYRIQNVKERPFSAPTVHLFKVDRFDGLLDFYFFDITDEKNVLEKRIPFGNRVAGSPVSKADLLANHTGTFKGTLPCASCDGIETTLTLNKNMTYQLTRVYLDRDDDIYKEKGIFDATDDLSAVKLTYKSEVLYYFLIDRNTVEQMDADGKRILSGQNYILKRK